MAAIFSEYDIEEKDCPAKDVKKWFYKQLEKLSSAPQGTDSSEEEEYTFYLCSLVRESDDLMQLHVSDAFAKSKWEKISIVIEDSDDIGDRGEMSTLINAIFDGLSRNTFLKKFCLDKNGVKAAISIPCLPPNLMELRLMNLDLHQDVTNNMKGLFESIKQHKHLKKLELHACRLCTKALGMALCFSKSLEHLVWVSYGDMKGFFDSVNNKTLQTLELHSCDNDELGISGIETMHKAFKDKRLTPQKLVISDCIDENEAPVVARMLTDYTTIKELDLTGNNFEDDGVQDIMASLQINTGLRSIDLSSRARKFTSKSAKIVRDFVRSRPDGTLESARIFGYCNDWPHGTQKEIDTLLDINKLKPLIRDSQGIPLSVLQHKRLDCTYFYIRSKPEVCWDGTDAKAPPRKRQKTHHDSTGGSWCTI